MLVFLVAASVLAQVSLALEEVLYEPELPANTITSLVLVMSNWVGFACSYAPYGPVQWRLPLGIQIPVRIPTGKTLSMSEAVAYRLTFCTSGASSSS